MCKSENWTDTVTRLYPSGLGSGDQLVVPTQLNGVRGKSVNFTATGSVLNNFQTLTWLFTPVGKTGVPVYTATQQLEKVPDSYIGRVTYYKSVNTLQLQSLTAADTGTYFLTVVDSKLDQYPAQTALQVLGMFHLHFTETLPAH